jgi:hypothetical protein
MGQKQWVEPYYYAIVYAGLGDKDRAFGYLARAFRERSLELAGGLEADPGVDSLRSDPRFQSLVSQVGLPVQ